MPERRSAARGGHDFEDKELGKVVLWRVRRWRQCSVGITSDTAQFAVASIHRWLAMGRERYPKGRELTIEICLISA